MTYTIVDTFNDKIRPFSDTFNENMKGLASDVANLNTYLPLLTELAIRRTPLVGGASDGSTFPALIQSETEMAGGRYKYFIKEVDCISASPEPVPMEGGKSGIALNVAEFAGPPGYKGTGLSQNCVSELSGSGSEIQVLSLVGQVILCSTYDNSSCGGDGTGFVAIPTSQDPEDGAEEGNPNTPSFFFHCWVPYCVRCSSNGSNLQRAFVDDGKPVITDPNKQRPVDDETLESYRRMNPETSVSRDIISPRQDY